LADEFFAYFFAVQKSKSYPRTGREFLLLFLVSEKEE